MIAEDILEWVATLPKWQQKLSYALIEKKRVTNEELDEIYEIFKIELALTEGDIAHYDIEERSYEAENYYDIKWRGVGNLRGVNRLKSGPVLSVSDGLTVVLGTAAALLLVSYCSVSRFSSSAARLKGRTLS